MLTGLKISEFLDKLGSNEPAPGGGSAAALAGAMGANLLTMVCALTEGKKGYEDYAEECAAARGAIGETATRLQQLVDEDTEAFNELMAAFKMPKKGKENKAARSRAIQEATKKATQTPLEVAELCRDTLRRAPRLAEIGNKNAISDVGVGALLLTNAVNGALLNVAINLPGLKDEAFVNEVKAKREVLLRGVATDLNAALAVVHRHVD